MGAHGCRRLAGDGQPGFDGSDQPTEALSGFSNPAVVTVWAILILSGGLARTGVAGQIGRVMLRLAGESESRLLLIIMLTVGVLSGVMNSIGVASLFLPVVIDIARRRNQPPSRYLIPLAFAALLGGMTTPDRHPPNILISEALREAGLKPFMMFDYTRSELRSYWGAACICCCSDAICYPNAISPKNLPLHKRQMSKNYMICRSAWSFYTYHMTQSWRENIG